MDYAEMYPGLQLVQTHSNQLIIIRTFKVFKYERENIYTVLMTALHMEMHFSPIEMTAFI